MPASSRWATPPSSASAPTSRACSPSTRSSTSRCWRCCCPALAAMLLGFVTSFLVLRGSRPHAHHGDARRRLDAARNRQPLRLAHRRRRRPAGRRDQARCSASSAFDMFGHTAYCYSLAVLFVLFLLARRIVNSPFGLSLRSRSRVIRCVRPPSAFPSTAGSSRSTRSPPAMPASPARC